MFRLPYHAVFRTIEEHILEGDFDQVVYKDTLHEINTDELIDAMWRIDEFTTSTSPLHPFGKRKPRRKKEKE